MTAATHLTRKQRAFLKLLVNGKAQICLHGSRAKAAGLERIIINLSKKIGLHYSMSGGWAAVSLPGVKCEEAGEHLSRERLAVVVAALRKYSPLAIITSHWDLLRLCQEQVPGFSYHAMMEGINYGARTGALIVKWWEAPAGSGYSTYPTSVEAIAV